MGGFIMEKFSKNEWNHFHDTIFDATFNTTKTDLTQMEMERLYYNLPEKLQISAELFGMNDTVWRGQLGDWYLENIKKTVSKDNIKTLLIDTMYYNKDLKYYAINENEIDVLINEIVKLNND